MQVSKFRYCRTKKAVEKLVLQTSENHFFFYAFGTDLGFGATHPHPNAMSQNCSHNISVQM